VYILYRAIDKKIFMYRKLIIYYIIQYNKGMKNLENIIDGKNSVRDVKSTSKTLPDRIFFCLSNPVRLRIILLLSKNKMNVNQLSLSLNTSQPETSAQLSILQDYGMVQAWQVGREKYYKIIPESIESVTSWMDDIATSISRDNLPELNSKEDFQNGRRCYDHVAGKSGVMILKSMLSMKWLIIKNDKPEYKLTELGETMLINIGVNLPVQRKNGRIFAYGCKDLTEKEYHLGGALGSEIMKALINQHYIEIYRNTRTIGILKPIELWFAGDVAEN